MHTELPCCESRQLNYSACSEPSARLRHSEGAGGRLHPRRQVPGPMGELPPPGLALSARHLRPHRRAGRWREVGDPLSYDRSRGGGGRGRGEGSGRRRREGPGGPPPGEFI